MLRGMRRPQDWLRQAELDREAVSHTRAGRHFEWATRARALDKHYMPARYPNSHPQGPTRPPMKDQGCDPDDKRTDARDTAVDAIGALERRC